MAGRPLIGKLVIIFFWGKRQNPDQSFMGKLNHKLCMYHSDVEVFAVTLLRNYLIWRQNFVQYPHFWVLGNSHKHNESW